MELQGSCRFSLGCRSWLKSRQPFNQLSGSMARHPSGTRVASPFVYFVCHTKKGIASVETVQPKHVLGQIFVDSGLRQRGASRSTASRARRLVVKSSIFITPANQ
jgi:hypothetical protein